MKSQFTWLAVIALAANFASRSTAGPHECTYYYSSLESSAQLHSAIYRYSCGWFNLGRCTGTRYYYTARYYYVRRSRQDCCSGWKRNGNGQCTVPICSPSCQYGGTCYNPNTCRCRSDNEYYGERDACSLRCPLITNCIVEQCTTISDVTCQQCISNISPTSIAYEITPNKKQCVSRCSWLNNWCWPGYCSGGNDIADSCTCALGFTGSPRCLTITSYSNVLVLDVSLGDSGQKHFANYTHPSSATVFTNIDPDKVIITMKAQFNGPQLGTGTFSTSRWKTDYRHYASPPWIANYHLGISRAQVRLTSVQDGSSTSQLLSHSNLHCTHRGSDVTLSNSAPASPVNCDFTFQFSGRKFSHYDRFNADVEVENGGYIVIKNMDSPSFPTTTHYYSGSTKIVTVPFVFDRVAPVHCSMENTIVCPSGVTSSSMLSVGEAVTKQKTLTVTWNGWYDTAGGSGISGYSLEIYRMEHKGHTLSEQAAPILRKSFDISAKTDSLTLDQSGLISVVLYVHDVAGNFRLTRRFVLYDESSTVAIDPHHSLSFPRAVNSGHALWKTVASGQLLANWTGFFYNTLIRIDPLLRSISPFRQTIDSGYDQPNTGTLGLGGTASNDGIVSYAYAITYGLNPRRPGDSAFQDVPRRVTGLDLWQHYTMATRTLDGDHVTVWVKAVDIWGNSGTHSAIIHVDFSSPDISNVGLARDGETDLTFLSSTDFHTMNTVFKIDDPHSGVITAFWGLGETEGGSEMGQDRVLTRTSSQSECLSSNCSCTALLICSYFTYQLDLHPSQFSRGSGQHARTYYLTINATNDAQLSSSKQIAITVDGSPPLAGHVIDGMTGHLDIDSQQSNTIQAYWLGFHDPDSGIHHYKYSVETSCLSKEDFSLGKKTVYRTSSESTGTVTVAGTGTYYVSVVAYNNALEPSKVVCSDGITVDNTPPALEQISVRHLRSTPGLITQTNSGAFWLVDNNRRRQSQTGIESACQQYALVVSDVSIYPLSVVNVSSQMKGTVCPYGPSSPYFYTHARRLSVSWKGFDDESGIHDYEVGVGRTMSEDPPTVLPFQSTKGHPHYSQAIPSLSEGQEYFLIVQATNKAGIKTKKAVGPIIVDFTAPLFKRIVHVNHNVQNKSVLISWTSSTFIDPEDSSLQYKVGAGLARGRDDLVPFTAIDHYDSCRVHDVCVSVPAMSFQSKTHGDVSIFFTVRARNHAGLSTTGTSNAYIHIDSSPIAGAVFDQLPSDEENVAFDVTSERQHDVDYQTSLSRLRCRWTGFTHPVSSVSLQIGVGAAPGSDDQVAFRAIDFSLHSYEIRNLTLRSMTTYFFTIIASNSAGYVSVSSDGIKTLNSSIEGEVYDGPGCYRPSSSHDVSSKNSWSQTPNFCVSEVQSGMSLSAGCVLSARIAATPGQWYTLTILATWRQSLTWNSTGLLVKAGDAIKLFAPDHSTVMDSDSWENISFPFKAIFSQTRLTLEVTSNRTIIIKNAKVVECKEDINFQSNDNVVAAHWSIGNKFLPFVTHYLWALFRNASEGLSAVTPYMDAGNTSYAFHTGLSLLETGHYIVSVRACNPSLCFQSIYSDGFRIMARSPVTSLVTAMVRSHQKAIDVAGSISIANATVLDVTLQWDPFVTFLGSGKKVVADVYSWTITVPGSSAPLISWRSLSSTGKVEITDTIRLEVSRRRTLSVVVRSYNQVGRHSDATAQVVMPSAHPLEEFLPTVYDVMPSKLKETIDPLTGRVVETSVSDTDEIDFVDSTHTLAAGWPWLKHGRSEWIVVRDSPIWHSCNSSVDVLACGTTKKIYHIVDNLSLKHGITYYFCIKILEIVGGHGIETRLTGSVMCSDGVTVDRTSPVEGEVFVGLGTHGSSYQTFTDTLMVRWRGFADVEEMTDFRSGIKEYSVALGTAPGQRDTADYITVGSATHWLFTGLTLENGNTYYASVKAVDHVQHAVTASSNAITVDTSPPVQGKIDIVGGETGYITGHFTGHWTGFEDKESGIASYQWCIGSGPGHDDAITCTSTTDDNFVYSGSDGLYPGHAYYVTVKAFNNAGLKTVETSNMFVFDDSPPVAGSVLDSDPGTDADWDYQQRLDTLTCQWRNFNDPQSSLRHFSVAFGSEMGTQDVVAFHNVGQLSNYTVTHVALEPGRPYYCTVVACNQADLCTTMSSDGVIADNSPPVIGLVHDGLEDEDVQYQSQSDVVGAKWFGIHDAHSSIARYEWCVGTAPNTDDLVPWTDTFTEQTAVKTGVTNLPSTKRIYTSVKAYNKAGLWSVTSSDGFIVDTTPPIIHTPPFFNTTTRSLRPNTQYSRSMVQASWKFDDSQSPIIRHTVVISTRDSVTPATQPIALGSERQTSVSQPNITLHDGERYYISVTACNAARLCVHQISREDLLVDSSPPLTGFISDHITWRIQETRTVIILRWKGFSDPHSGVYQYIISIGTTYSGNQYTPVYVHANHSGGRDSEQSADVTIQRHLIAGERLYVSLWAINGVDLRSDQVHVSMIAGLTSSVSGVLTIEKHSCVVTSCLGHCTCAISSSLCDRRLFGSNCTKVLTSDVPIDSRLTVSDFLTSSLLTSSASTSSLQGSWTLDSSSPSWPPVRYEVTAGTLVAPGDGIYDVKKERVWHEVGLMTNAVITLPPSRHLVSRTIYVIYVRVWYSGSKYAVFHSRGITPDISPPKLSSRQRVKDLTPLVTGDVDFVTNHTDKLSVSWQGSFSDPQSGIDHFSYSFGTTPGADDVVPFTSISSKVYTATHTGLILASGVRYYATVQAVNLLGMHQTTTTDGVVIDTEVPLAGVVLDGDQQHDLQYQSNNTTLSAQWHGFFDRHSFIESYYIGIGDSPGTWNFNDLINVGLKLFVSVRGLSLLSGVRYHATVVAVDAAGLKSPAVSSNGVMIDSSAPVFITCQQYGQNLLKDATDNNATLLGKEIPSGWTVDSGKMTTNISDEGKRYVVISGTISRKVVFTKDVLYELNIQARSVGLSHTQHMEIRADRLHKVIALGPRGTPAKRYSFEIMPERTEEGVISIKSASSVGDVIAIDSVVLKMCLRHSSEQSTPNSSLSRITRGRHYLGPYDTVEAVWRTHDSQSGIKESLWAIGTVKGGQQLQTYRSVGLANHATNQHADLRHGMNVFLTIVAINNAGLATTLQPSSLLVDLTPPEVAEIVVAALVSRFDTDVLYIANSTVTASWNGTADPESGIHYCQWGIGLSPMSTELLSFQTTNQSDFGDSVSADVGPLRSGQKCYVTVRCYNNVGLSSTHTSVGTPYIAEPPDGVSALVTLDVNVDSPYEPRGAYQTSNNSVSFHWAGFHDQAGISHYQVKVQGASLSAADWFNVGHYTRAEVSGLDMKDGHQYTVAVRAVNYGGLQSNEASVNFTVVENAPSVTGNSILGDWGVNGQLTLSWLNVFKSEDWLAFELTVGTHPGSGDVLQWFETATTMHTLDAGSVSRFRDYHVAVTAINAVGLHTTIATTIQAEP